MKSWKTLSTVALAGVLLAGCVGCNSWTTGDWNNDIDHSQNDTTDRSGWVLRERPSADTFSNQVLNITFYNGGYGRDWIDEMKIQFEKDYPGVTVRLTASDNVNGTLQTELKNSPEDIYISHDIAWETYGSQGLIADLTTDLYEATIYTDTKQENLPIRFKDLLAPSSLTCSAYMGKYYKVAQVQGAGGIIYNKTLFDEHGWKLPETYDELAALCETIYTSSSGKIAPFLVAGTEGYLWDSLVYDWWIQLAGEEEFNRLFEGEDKTCWDPSVYPYHKQAYQYWYDLFVKNKDKYLLKGFESMSNITANEMFVAGLAAMMPATAWAVNELGADVVEEAGIDVGLIPTPYLKDAKKDEKGNYLRVCYDVAGRDSIIVAEKGNKELAIEFLKWMSETEHALLFPKNVSGLLMGFQYESATLLKAENGYCNYTWDKDMFRLLSETSFRSTGYSANPMFVYKLVSAYPKENHYLDCFTTYGKNGAYTPDSVFSQAWDEVNAKWDTWRYEAGLS